ncbi:hypothetical protein Acel_0123 [Acidothermus cellulolyticus 11B]|uniref:Uncharacterized protein n=1 Tax=Acidothermus cellulolyticus (strain ATCC 43068 / DSM 8971 / 11B) TaxID=351607 RepID=A0LR39_ACIC1|nr:hypothetical protein Acel_0123 [Acidothermus cellulolyticus 11B]
MYTILPPCRGNRVTGGLRAYLDDAHDLLELTLPRPVRVSDLSGDGPLPTSGTVVVLVNHANVDRVEQASSRYRAAGIELCAVDPDGLATESTKANLGTHPPICSALRRPKTRVASG